MKMTMQTITDAGVVMNSGVGSGVFSMQTPMPSRTEIISNVGAIILKDETALGTEGDCFSVHTNGSKKNCFSVYTNEEECFSITSYRTYDFDDDEDNDKDDEWTEDEDEDDILEEPPPLIEIDGFSSIKCVQSHGFNSLKVIGMYTPDGGEERAVIADVTYTQSVIGGVGSFDGVYYYVNLSELGMDDINLVDRLDGWDILSTTSSLCIVYDENVYWLDPVLLGVQNDTTTHPNPEKAVADPYFSETTYAWYAMPLEYSGFNCKPAGVLYRWEFRIGTMDCTSNTADCGSDDIRSCGYSTAGWGDNGSHSMAYIGNYAQSDGAEIDSNECQRYLTPVLENPCWFQGLTNAIGDLRHKRKEFSLLNHGEIGYVVDGTATVYCGSSMGYYTTMQPDEWQGLQRHWQQNVGVMFDDTGINATLEVSGKKLCYDGNFYANTNGNTIFYTNADGTISGSKAGYNFTLSNGVLVMADGSSTLKQTVLDDE